MTAMLYGVEASDAATFAGVAAVMGAAGLLAALWPAKRAAGLDVVEALRR
jgi:ABC-type antimicrobial peptide transport system permease subunit